MKTGTSGLGHTVNAGIEKDVCYHQNDAGDCKILF
jgi:hypothetical protein